MSVSIFVTAHDRPGVLARVTGQFVRRGYNIVSLTSRQKPEEPGMAQMTIVVGIDERAGGQFVRQLNKLIDVIKVEYFPN
ncbi:acetolactate synthase small subunit [Tumebacillus sp. DT12]|uniref:Acetolactate synthase small subunit n=1 Tax=Tumebacillus lacus TaxID=2995335 RepID=A0ABT3X4X5_9BACL|nr:acetolactate synthase small subunit [Tumebacillus lacus]MCX7571953.1 acetolactate synthase small subunit [Tumebacillus lacus]